MPTLYTQRLLIVVRAAIQQQANEAAQVADPTTDLTTFSVPLRTAGGANTPVAYWAGWTMTQAQRDRLVLEFGNRIGQSLTPYSKGDVVRKNRDYWLFTTVETAGSAGFTPQDVLVALGMDTYASTIGG